MRGAVLSQLDFTVSAGIAQNKLLAKIGSAKNKPNQQTIVLPRAVEELMQVRRAGLRSEAGQGCGWSVGTLQAALLDGMVATWHSREHCANRMLDSCSAGGWRYMQCKRTGWGFMSPAPL